jgi:hypothetical protein
MGPKEGNGPARPDTLNWIERRASAWRRLDFDYYGDAIHFETLIPRSARGKATACITASQGEHPRADFMESFL